MVIMVQMAQALLKQEQKELQHLEEQVLWYRVLMLQVQEQKQVIQEEQDQVEPISLVKVELAELMVELEEQRLVLNLAVEELEMQLSCMSMVDPEADIKVITEELIEKILGLLLA